MIRRLKGSRYLQFIALLSILAIALVVRLFVITVFQHGTWSNVSEDMSTKTISVTAPRGEIYDRYGRLLAGNKQQFSVRISSSGLTDEELNENISRLLEILDENGDKIEDEFPIVISDGKYEFTYQTEIKTWLKSMGFSTSYSAEEAFNALRSLFSIDPALDRYEAQEELQTTYNQYPPISVSDMEYTANQEKNTFIETYFGDDKKAKKMTAQETFEALREEMNIDESLSDAQARRIMVVRNAIESSGYSKYLPVIVAKDVSNDSVMLIEEEGDNLKGVEAVSETTRYYPNKNTASHVLGYVGFATEDQMEENSDYKEDSIAGQEGIEGNLENVLKGSDGEQTVLVNSTGEQVDVISETEAVKGQDVYLTIDLDLQEAAETGLENTLSVIKYGGTVQSEYGSSELLEAAPNAETGACVAIDVDTGDVLAMASYPDFDPNLFSEGISDEDWASLQSENLRDPLAPSPLYNLATMCTVQPGSTFKPVTATAALQCGLDPDTQLNDAGAIKLSGHTFACWIWNNSEGQSTHGYLNLEEALAVSCNYYFYDVSTGKDWANGGASLGFDKEITHDTITDYAEQYGLGLPTGIEIDEAVVAVPSEERRLETLQTNLSYELYANAENWFDADVVNNAEKLDENIKTMTEWLSQDEVSWNEMYDNMLPDMGVKKSARQEVGELILYNYYPQVAWSTADTFNLAIGQGENAYTPIQMANYIATIGNKGTHNQASLVKSIEDEGANQKEAATKVEVDDQKYFDYILEGMKMVVSGAESSIKDTFSSLDVEVAAKTGTAERSGYINPASEVDYIKEHLSSIAPSLTWAQVEKEMNRLMDKYPDVYSSQDTAVRKAVMNLTNDKVTADDIDIYKSEYENFAWVVALAPADDPEIAVVAMVPQGSTAANAAPIVKEVIGAYFEKKDTDYKILTIDNKVE